MQINIEFRGQDLVTTVSVRFNENPFRHSGDAQPVISERHFLNIELKPEVKTLRTILTFL
jgi:hypothetical protein